MISPFTGALEILSSKPDSGSATETVIGPGLSLRVPVMQAPLGSCDGPLLAAAVSEAGALGCLTVHAPDEGAFSADLLRLRSLTERRVLLAFTAQWEPDTVRETALSQGFRVFQFFWWNGPRHTAHVRAAGGTVLWQVGALHHAQDALDAGAHVLVVQGTEAGGQVRSPTPVMDLLAELRGEFGPDIPIIAGGGFADVSDVRRVLNAGANAALMGTRFLLTEESSAPQYYKETLVEAQRDDLMLDIRLIGDWPCAPRRRLATAEDHPGLFAGLGIGRINALAPAAQIVNDLDPTQPG